MRRRNATGANAIMSSKANKRYIEMINVPGGLENPKGFSSLEDTWILRQRAKSYKIETTVTWLFDNLRFWF